MATRDFTFLNINNNKRQREIHPNRPKMPRFLNDVEPLERRVMQGGSTNYIPPNPQQRGADDSKVEVDRYHPDPGEWHVVEENGIPYHAMMKKQMCNGKKEKVYIMQVIQNNTTNQYCVYTRHNYIGKKYKRQFCFLIAPDANATKKQCVSKFKDKFYRNTLGQWDYLDHYEPREHKWKYIPSSRVRSNAHTGSTSRRHSEHSNSNRHSKDNGSDHQPLGKRKKKRCKITEDIVLSAGQEAGEPPRKRRRTR